MSVDGDAGSDYDGRARASSGARPQVTIARARKSDSAGNRRIRTSSRVARVERVRSAMRGYHGRRHDDGLRLRTHSCRRLRDFSRARKTLHHRYGAAVIIFSATETFSSVAAVGFVFAPDARRRHGVAGNGKRAFASGRYATAFRQRCGAAAKDHDNSNSCDNDASAATGGGGDDNSRRRSRSCCINFPGSDIGGGGQSRA